MAEEMGEVEIKVQGLVDETFCKYQSSKTDKQEEYLTKD